MRPFLTRLDAALAALEERLAAALPGAAPCSLMAGPVMRSAGLFQVRSVELAVRLVVMAACFRCRSSSCWAS